MGATRTQIYLTSQQRRRLDELRQRSGASLAELIRLAVDEYLDAEPRDLAEALDESFGAAPGASAPSRDEWDRGSDLEAGVGSGG
ncbi:hypothetical protein BH24ACT23_BH24ACT23_00350 [soil metagenome]